MSLHSRWESRIVVPTGGWTDSGNFTLTESAGGGAQDVTVTAGNYWWNSGDGGGNSFLAQIKADLEAASFNGLTYTVTLGSGEKGTGKLTITVSGGGTATLNFGSNDGITFANLCGLGDPHTTPTAGSSAVQGLWLPDCPADSPFDFTSPGKPVAQSVESLAPDGTYSAFQSGSKHFRNEFVYVAVTEAKCIEAAESTVNESFESFWEDCIRGEAAWANVGRQFRFYKDVDDDATFKTYNVLKTNTPEYERFNPDWDGLWRVRLEVVENV